MQGIRCRLSTGGNKAMKLEQAARQALGLLEDAAEPAATQTKADEGMVAQWDVNALETIAALREA